MAIKKTASDGVSKWDRKIMAIANTAAKLFSSKGYIETSMEDVATAAKISKGAIYHYFECKSDILDYILSAFMDAVLENARQDLEEIDDPSERMRIVILRHVRTYTGHMFLAKTLLDEAHNLPAPKLRKIKAKEREYFAFVSGVLSSYLKGSIDKESLTVLTFSLLGMCNWIYSWYDPQGAISPDQLSQIIFENFTRGLSRFQEPGAGRGTLDTTGVAGRKRGK